MLHRILCLVLTLVAVLATIIAATRVEAARDYAPPAPTGLEIIVMEVSGCRYCPLFRQDVAPAYSASPRARDVPLRFMDVTAVGADQLKLKAPIDTVPTAVLMRDHVEIGRIEGYVGAETFARLVTQILSNP